MDLQTLGYDEPQIEADIKRYVEEHDTIEGAPHLKDEHLPVFDCAFKPANGVRSIGWQAHVQMMAAAQPFLSGAISKTVNMPRDTTRRRHRRGLSLGLGNGTQGAGHLPRRFEAEPAVVDAVGGGQGGRQGESGGRSPKRERLPDTRQSLTHKFNVGGHEGYINVGLYPDGRPGELFLTMAKEGSTVGGMMDAFGTAISMSLQYGVPLEVLVNKFSHMRFEPMGHTTNPDIRIAKSVVDYIFRWLGNTFLPGFREASIGLPPATHSDKVDANSGNTAAAEPVSAAPAAANGNGQVDYAMLERAGVAMKVDQNSDALAGRSEQFARFQSDAPSCDTCGAITVRNGNCYLCHNCGNSMGCS